jgi:peptidoglycan/xylan/chitin deacetylase (PgdA/CDA1 family)
MGARSCGRRLLASLAVSVLLAGCASNASVPPAATGPVQASPATVAGRTRPPTPGQHTFAPAGPVVPERSLASSPLAPSPSPALSASPGPTAVAPWPIGFTLHVPILTYHLVATPAEVIGSAIPSLVIPPALFDAQLTRLASAGWHTITLRQLAADLAAHRRPARHTFVITIDDGHVDGFTQAFPILQRHRMTATYFVIAGRIGKTGYLGATQLQALAAAGMEIGDHSMTHVDLAALPPARLLPEIGGAATVLESIVGTAPVSFAYPIGAFDAATMRAVAGAGLQLAVTYLEPGVVETASLRYRIPRLHVGSWTSPAMLLSTVAQYPGQ